MRIVSIIEGSVIIDFEVIIDEETLKSEVISEMQSSSTENGTDSGAGSSSTCGSVSNKIAEGLSQGSLDMFGSQVSNMSYACSEVIEDDAQFNTTLKQESSQPGGGTSLINDKVVVLDAEENGGVADNINKYLQDSDTKTQISTAYYVMAFFVLLLSFIIYITCRTRKIRVPQGVSNKIMNSEKQPIIEQDLPTKRI